jgi:hypothetical protein
LEPAYIPNQTTLNGVIINPELAILPENLCYVWTATRDCKQRKFNYTPNYRYGLNLQINRKTIHVFLLILLAGDVATNPGPCSSGIRSQNSQLKSLVLNARRLKSINRDEVSNQTVCNLQRFQNLVCNEYSDYLCERDMVE